jgi:hypothetical protein
MTAAFEMTLETLRLNRPYYISSEVGNLSLFNSTGSTKPNITQNNVVPALECKT